MDNNITREVDYTNITDIRDILPEMSMPYYSDARNILIDRSKKQTKLNFVKKAIDENITYPELQYLPYTLQGISLTPQEKVNWSTTCKLGKRELKFQKKVVNLTTVHFEEGKESKMPGKATRSKGRLSDYELLRCSQFQMAPIRFQMF